MNKHLYLRNSKSENPSYNRKRGYGPNNEDNEEESPKVINKSKIRMFRSNYLAYNRAKGLRDENRTLKLPVAIDFIQIRFYKTFNYDLQKKFYERYGIIPIEYTDFNRTVLFEIGSIEDFNVFKGHLKRIINSDESIEYSGQDFNLIALIHEFSFFENRLNTTDTEGLVVNLVPKSSKAADSQIKSLIEFLKTNQIDFEIGESEELIYVKKISSRLLDLVGKNFDVVKVF